MALAYVPPGVNVSEFVTPSASPLLTTPNNLCIVGRSQGYIQRTDQITLNGTTATVLPNLPLGAALSAVASVTNANSPITYAVTTDYTVNLSNGTVTRVSSGSIPDGAQVNVVYQYVPADYWATIRLDSFGAVQNRFGPAYDSNGNVATPLSFAAMMAFQNGAQTLVCQPLFVRATPGDPSTVQSQPNDSQAAASTSWADTLYVLRDIEDVDVIVPTIGQSQANVNDAAWLAAVQTIQDHIAFMQSSENQYIVSVLGEDSSASNSVATAATIRTHTTTLQSRQTGTVNQNIVMVNTSKFTVINSVGTNLIIGGQYAAAAIGGMIVGGDPSQTLTRKTVSGLTAVNDYRSKADKGTDASTGLMVLEQKGNSVVIRHAITIDNSSVSRSELSVVRQKFFMISSIQQTIDRNIVGQVIADANALVVISASITGILEALKSRRAIVDYGNIDARYQSLNPTIVEVRFSYLPSFPVNYVNIVFSIDLSGGILTSTQAPTQI